MEDWKQVLQSGQSVIIGVLFSFLVAKLISIVVSFREDNLTLTRNNISTPQSLITTSEDDDVLHSVVPSSTNTNTADDDVDDDDDWEGVESTELDEHFSAAIAFVASIAADVATKVPNDAQLRLYAFYKIATEGPCTQPQPPPFKFTARAKWQAWQKLGAMTPEDAMLNYIEIVSTLFPTWAAGSTSKAKGDGSSDPPSGDTRGPVGPVFSSFIYEEESGNDLKMDAIHAFAREGEQENLIKCIDQGVPVDLKDSEGRTPLHWAVDRGHLNIIELLLRKSADINAKDNEGQTPLHYAAVCDREVIGEYLVKQKADTEIKDDEGNSPFDLCDTKWTWLKDADMHNQIN